MKLTRLGLMAIGITLLILACPMSVVAWGGIDTMRDYSGVIIVAGMIVLGVLAIFGSTAIHKKYPEKTTLFIKGKAQDAEKLHQQTSQPPKPTGVPSSKLVNPKQGKKKERAFTLGKMVDYRQIPQIQPYLDDGDVEVRRAAISSLEQQWSTGDSYGILLLTKKLQDNDAEVRATAALAIGEFIPRANTDLAIEMGSEAIKALFRLLEIEQDEKVLGKMFVALANLDDRRIISSFSEATKKLGLSTLYVGMRNIGLLRSTSTRKEMVSILQSITEKLESSTGTTTGQDIGDYHGKPIVRSDVDVLIALEQQIGKQIPLVTSLNAWTFGMIVENKQVVELGLNSKNLESVPGNIGQLSNLRVLWISSNKIKMLPESFGNLKALTFLEINRNQITSLPDSIVNLDKLEFVHFDREVEKSSSKKVIEWIRKQEKKAGTFLWS